MLSSLDPTDLVTPSCPGDHTLTEYNLPTNIGATPTNHGRRVLLLRNLPTSVSDRDVETFITPFARSVSPKIYLQFAAGQAFVEFGTAQEAESAYEYFKEHPTSLKGQIVAVYFSDRQAVTAPTDDRNANFRVLLATVTNLMYPVDIELLRFLFTRFGRVQKIISFSKSNSSSTFQALIQMAEPQMALSALKELHGRNIYDGCNTLQIQPSRLPELVVRTNNNRAWDYTIAPEGVPARLAADARSSPDIRPSASHTQMFNRGDDNVGVPNGSMGRFNSIGFQRVFQMTRLPREARDWKAALMSQTAIPTAVLIVYNLTPGVVTVNEIFNVFSSYGVLLRVKILRDKPHTALLQFSDPLYASLALHFLQGVPLFDPDLGMQIGFSRNAEVKLSNAVGPETLKRTRAFHPQEQRYPVNEYGGAADMAIEVEKYIRAACPPTCTLFIANLRDSIEEADVRELVGVFGEIRTVEIRLPPSAEGLASRRKYAMVEMVSRHDALVALAKLHNTTYEGGCIKVAFSKMSLTSGLSPTAPVASSGSVDSSASSLEAGGISEPQTKPRVGTASTTD